MNITDRKILHDGFYKLTQLLVQDGPEQLKRERFEPGSAVAALVFDTQKQRYVFVRQFRVGSESELLEIPAGMLDKQGEDPEQAIRREIQEELGYEVDQLTFIRNFYSSPGGSAEQLWLYYAEVSRQTGAGGGVADEHENIDVVLLSYDELVAEPWQDAKTLIAAQWVQLQ
ncbi:NUDIX domain-containing protein [Hymenobacter chitinivorans]|uniref:GDP-mannose pyrophosphatase n=1 Tax=Hymenobacter chitinivorans DSM 11115 TaxID=1121954 RepID=A0A2M9BRU3_9BACT|nr:NUDIX hydrolase [Hymenobacter chitinivorans]PJJ60658.1 ADP-ribose pyrophosphatase [Hymenobacter chitinivorans DSM 11115]